MFVSVIEGYLIYRAMVTVFNTRQFSSKIFYVLGYGVPGLTVLLILLTSLAGKLDLYLRRDSEGEVEACFLSDEAMLAIVIPAGEIFSKA